jgi:hypothetical protein
VYTQHLASDHYRPSLYKSTPHTYSSWKRCDTAHDVACDFGSKFPQTTDLDPENRGNAWMDQRSRPPSSSFAARNPIMRCRRLCDSFVFPFPLGGESFGPFALPKRFTNVSYKCPPSSCNRSIPTILLTAQDPGDGTLARCRPRILSNVNVPVVPSTQLL